MGFNPKLKFAPNQGAAIGFDVPGGPEGTGLLVYPSPSEDRFSEMSLIGAAFLTQSLPQLSPPEDSKSDILTQVLRRFEPCQDFFMENLTDPYPTASQKQDLQARGGITVTSLNQWFTNIRRRSGWMDILKTHANSRKDEMKSLIEGVLYDPHYPARQEAKDAITKMRAYVAELSKKQSTSTL
ncbi:hypothetical protein FRC04_010121 [Tulasnella sp. 424]|nr:hypothetical protein FRC04_010121 [Tulasnella sp. 424]